MKKGVSSTPREIRGSSNEDELVSSSIYARQINTPDLSLRSWVGPVQVHLSTDLPTCMEFIKTHGCIENPSHNWIQCTLNLISLTAAPNSLDHIINGYADLYELVIYLIKYADNVLFNQSHILTFGGISSNAEQQERRRNLAFIVYDCEKFLFVPLYVTRSNGNLQTCFDTDDENIIDQVVSLVRGWNYEISQNLATEKHYINNNDNAMNNAEGSQATNNLDALLPSEPIVQDETVSITPQISENDIQYASRTIVQSDFHSNHGKIITNSLDSVINALNSSFDRDSTEERVRERLNDIEKLLNRARQLLQEVDDVASMETDDRRLVTNETLKEREQISKNAITNVTQNKSVHAKQHVRSSHDNHSHAKVCLNQSTTEPTTITGRDAQTVSTAVQLYDPPNVKIQPKSHRRVRMLTDLANNDCPFVQGGEKKVQRKYPMIEEVPDDGDGELHIRVRVVTENKLPHPFKTVVPENAHVDLTLMKDNNERMCLRCDADSFDPEIECVYLKITTDERRKHEKKVKVRLFNWKQYGPTIKEVIENENLRLCRLEFYYCKQLGCGKYQLVSQPSYTSVIEDKDGDVTIDAAKIEPKQLCELGGEKIIVPLNVQCPKKGFCVECNENELHDKKFIMERKKLLITSPPKMQGVDDLHLTIKRTEYSKNSSTREVNTLFDGYLPYVSHDQYVHSCSQPVLAVSKNQS